MFFLFFLSSKQISLCWAEPGLLTQQLKIPKKTYKRPKMNLNYYLKYKTSKECLILICYFQTMKKLSKWGFTTNAAQLSCLGMMFIGLHFLAFF